MASVDWTNYVDLSAYDESATTLLSAAVEHARTLIPEWKPDAGSIEVVILEALCTVASRVISAANRVPGATVETLLKLFDVERSDGEKATAAVTITTVDSAGYTIPSGTALAYFPTNGTDPLVYLLDSSLTIAPGSSSYSAAVTAQIVGSDYNTPGANSRLQVLTSMPYIQSVYFLTAPSGGADAESDSEFFARAVTTLASYSSSIATEDQLEARILTDYTVVHRCKAYSQRRADDRDTTDAFYTTHDGHVLVAVAAENADIADTSDTILGADTLQTIEDEMSDLVVANLEIEVVNAQLVGIDIDATFEMEQGLLGSIVEGAVEDALQAYLSPNGWDWEQQTIRMNEIISLIDRVEGVRWVTEVVLTVNSGYGSYATESSGDIIMHYLGSLPVAMVITLDSTQT